MVEQLRRRKKRKWVLDWIRRRDQLGASARLMRELAEEDPKGYRNIMRMAEVKFEELLEMVSPLIRKKDTVMREALSAKTKLEIALRYLSAGESLKSLQYLFRVPHNTISTFLPEVLGAIFEVLQPYIKVPPSTDEWKAIQKAFECRWNFPNCCGALDGKHIQIMRPKNSASLFFNYKGTYSIILFAMVDADYCFRYIDVGRDGRSSDSTVFRNSSLNAAMEQNFLNWPTGGLFVGDDAFPIQPYLLKPYSHRWLSDEERIFNYRLSRARRVAENAFGILAARFRIFCRPINLSVETIDLVVKAACALHNWLRVTSTTYYLPQGSLDMEDPTSGEPVLGAWRQEPTAMLPVDRLYSSNNYKRDGEEVRKRYARAFMTDLAVPWQYAALRKS
ncbi:hypothetical protein B7P43_G14377 [Cryptotermes secundus]|uniref:DDE Tnp4 domain-containing protein n=2 Tax=Cryptotermes secundus TaxID=105785 RepID=A0A2J7Q1P7_9NEOP|nr:hypothetical protein B7P43_G14377 [Cryptotermes secundus]